MFPFNSDHLLWKQRPVVKVWKQMAFGLLRLHTYSYILDVEKNRCMLMSIFVMLQDWPSSLDQYYGIRLETYGTSMGLEDDVNLSDASPARYEKFLKEKWFMSKWVPKFQSADRCEELPGGGVREHRPQCGAEGLRCFQAEGRAGRQGSCGCRFFLGLDWKGLGFFMDWFFGVIHLRLTF